MSRNEYVLKCLHWRGWPYFTATYLRPLNLFVYIGNLIFEIRPWVVRHVTAITGNSCVNKDQLLAPKRPRWEVEWFDEGECLLTKHELTNAHCEASHNGEQSLLKLQTKTRQTQTKHKLKQQTILELPMNFQSVYKMFRWNARVYQMACCGLGTRPHHTHVKTYNIS